VIVINLPTPHSNISIFPSHDKGSPSLSMQSNIKHIRISTMSQAGVGEKAPGAFNNNFQSSAYRHQSHPNNAPAGAKAHIFQPPRTPSTSSSMHLGRSTASLFSIESDNSVANLSSRKRSRAEISGESSATPVARAHGWSTSLNTSDVMETSLDFESPAPFVTTRYELAGGLNTPSAYAETRREAEEREYFDTGFRRGFGDAGNTSHLQAQSRYVDILHDK